jgi:hypothetical protein
MKGCKLIRGDTSTTIKVTKHIKEYNAYFRLKHLNSKVVSCSSSMSIYIIPESSMSWLRLVRFLQQFVMDYICQKDNSYILSTSEMVNVLYISPKQLCKDMIGPVHSLVGGDREIKDFFNKDIPSDVFYQIVSQYVMGIGNFTEFQYNNYRFYLTGYENKNHVSGFDI